MRQKSHQTSTPINVTGLTDTSVKNKGKTLQTEPQRTDKAKCAMEHYDIKYPPDPRFYKSHTIIL